MEIVISRQLIQAALYMGFGVLVGFMYDLVRAFRKRSGHKPAEIIFDMLYCIFLGAGILLLSMSADQGRVRVDLLLFTVSGGGIYFLAFSRICYKLCKLLAKMVGEFFHILGMPLVWMKKFAKKIKNVFKSNKIWYKIKSNLQGRDEKKHSSRKKEEAVSEETEKIKGRYTY